jgi:hypothetical protein
MAEPVILERTAVVRRGRKLEYLTIAWNALEGLVAVVAGAIAGSIFARVFFHIDLERQGKMLCPRLTGEEGIKPFIRSEFQMPAK